MITSCWKSLQGKGLSTRWPWASGVHQNVQNAQTLQYKAYECMNSKTALKESLGAILKQRLATKIHEELLVLMSSFSEIALLHESSF